MIAKSAKGSVILIFKLGFVLVAILGSNALAETRVVIDFSRKTAQALVRSRGPIPVSDADKDGWRLFQALRVKPTGSGSLVKSIQSGQGELFLQCTQVSSLQSGICNLSLKEGVHSKFDKENLGGAEFRLSGVQAVEFSEFFLAPGSTLFVYEDSTGAVAISSTSDQFLLKLKSH